jgi:hypothetical protein
MVRDDCLAGVRMIQFDIWFFAAHTILAVILFFMVNWIGKHAVDFGYVSTSLFEEPNENIALNLFIRTLSPSVFIIIISSATVLIGRPELRLGILNVVFYYYFFRACIIFFFNRHRLISWTRYFGNALFGSAVAVLAYHYLILPNRSLLPDLQAAGNELWLALLAFLYAVANKIPLSGGPGARRRNAFVRVHYTTARRLFGDQIDAAITDNLLKLVAYSILIYEDYCRPPAIRSLERLAWWKKRRTTGIMQVSAAEVLTDEESVTRGLSILSTSWEKHSSQDKRTQVRSTISEYNKDEDYIERVQEVMKILAERTDPSFKLAYDSLLDE